MSASERVVALFERGQVIKVCGIRESAHAEAAAEAGADILGFIFAPSRRQVTAETARGCVAAARDVKPDILACGVFVNAAAEEIADTSRAAGLDLVQMHGDEGALFAASLPTPAVRVLRPEPGVGAPAVLETIKVYERAAVPPVAYMLDTFSAAAAGGTGEKLDWDLASEVNGVTRIVLAGGLDPGNVADAIALVHPLGVDASSGMEVDGRKSAELIHAFVRAARAAFAAESAPTIR